MESDGGSSRGVSKEMGVTVGENFYAEYDTFEQGVSQKKKT